MKTLLFTSMMSLMVLANSAFAIEDTYFKGENLDFPYREQAIIASKNGFYPNKIVVFKGEKVRFFITTTEETNSCFNIPDKNVFATPKKSEVLEREVFFGEAGVFAFNCPNNSYAGRVMVLEKISDKKEAQRRGLASDVTKIWRPKEEPTEWVQVKKEELKEDYIDLDRDEGNEVQLRDREYINFGRDLATAD